MRFKGMLVFTRHGETDWNVQKRIQGRTDIPLNDRGRAQAPEVAAKLKAEGVRIRVVLTSSLRRAAEYACRIVDGLGANDIRLIEDTRMVECAFGSFEGKTLDEIVAWSNGSVSADIMRYQHGKPYDYRPYGGESSEQVLARQLEAVDDAAQFFDRDDDGLLLCGHGRSLATLLAYLNAPYSLFQGAFYAHRVF